MCLNIFNMLNKVLFLLAAATIVLTGCVDEELSPVVTQETLLFGAFPFLEELRTGEFDLANLSSSAYEMDVSFVDNNAGEFVAQYNVYVSFDDNNPDNGDLSTESTLWKSFTPADFSVLGVKNSLGLTLRIPFSEVAGFVGAGAEGDVISGDRFQFRTEIVHTDGRVFSEANSTSAITTAFGGIWDFNVTATCPLADTDFVGPYTVSYGYIYEPYTIFGRVIQGWYPDPMNETVTLALRPGSTTIRDFGTEYLVPSNLQSSINIALEFACDVVTAVSSDSGVRCAGAGWRPVQINTASFNLMDDSTWTIEFRDWGGDDNNGSCGDIPAQEYSVIFTKQ